jgi:hypothetical protein
VTTSNNVAGELAVHPDAQSSGHKVRVSAQRQLAPSDDGDPAGYIHWARCGGCGGGDLWMLHFEEEEGPGFLWRRWEFRCPSCQRYTVYETT